jgi:hypothetical protein
VGQVVEHLPSKHEALNSNSYTAILCIAKESTSKML